MASKQKILIVDDDENIAELISLYLTKECYETQIVHDGESALLAVPSFKPDLILLDLMLPGIDGYQVCRELRKDTAVPIIMLSAKGEVFDKVLGLELGADDYIIKPFDSKELVARVKAVLRRTKKQEIPREYHYKELTVDMKSRKVWENGRSVDLTLKEFELLRYLLENQGTVLSREKILEKIWGYEIYGETRTVDVHIRTLRQKLGDSGSLIETVRGVGYRIGEET